MSGTTVHRCNKAIL